MIDDRRGRVSFLIIKLSLDSTLISLLACAKSSSTRSVSGIAASFALLILAR
jgi:hypothetical protein